jgi:hypothetical protein
MILEALKLFFSLGLQQAAWMKITTARPRSITERAMNAQKTPTTVT